MLSKIHGKGSRLRVNRMSDTKKKEQTSPQEITLLSRKDYQPSRAELREEFDMPGVDIETVRKAFFQPVKVVEPKED